MRTVASGSMINTLFLQKLLALFATPKALTKPSILNWNIKRGFVFVISIADKYHGRSYGVPPAIAVRGHLLTAPSFPVLSAMSLIRLPKGDHAPHPQWTRVPSNVPEPSHFSPLAFIVDARHKPAEYVVWFIFFSELWYWVTTQLASRL